MLAKADDWPLDELRPLSSFEHMYSTSNTLIYATISNKGSVVGFISGVITPVKKIALIEYLYVLPSYRRNKFGSQMLKLFLDNIVKYGAKICVVEYDPPDENSEEARMRRDWYCKRGFCESSIPYLQPPYSELFDPKPMALGFYCLKSSEIEDLYYSDIAEIHDTVYAFTRQKIL